MDSSWLGWVQENLQRKCDPEGILEILLKNKFSVQEIQDAMGSMFPINSIHLEGLMPRPAAQADMEVMLDIEQQFHKHRSLLTIQHAMSRLNPKNKTIERRWGMIPRDEFVERYYAANRPVIISGIMHNWTALQRWTPDYLKAVCGEEMVEIMKDRDKNPLYEIEMNSHRTPIRFADYIDMVVSSKETNDYYMVARNDFFKRPGVKPMLRDIQFFPEYLKMDFSGAGVNLWFGPKGTVTPLHHDEMNIFMAQVQGRKHIKLVPADELDLIYNHYGVYSHIDCENPDYNKFPKFRDATVLDCELAPGDVLFLPVGWWHHVRALDMSITVSMTNFIFPNNFQWSHPQLENGESARYEEPEVKAAEEIHPHTLPATLPGVDYSALTRIHITRMESGVVHIADSRLQLYIMDDLLTAQECDALVDITNRDLRPSTITVDNGDKYFRTSRTSDLFAIKDPIVGQVDQKIADAVGICLPYSELMQAQKYEAGQEFKPHTDYFEPRTPEYVKYATHLGNRTWTCMVYLNDTPKGGGTRFTKIDQTFYPKKGQAVIWNNLHADGTPNRDSEHHGMIVEEGEKYVITKWFREKGNGPMFC